MRVLLVDDNPGFLESASTLLSFHPDVEVVGQARSGPEGVRLAAELLPDLVLMDLAMPGMSGASAMRLIKSQPNHVPRVAIVSFYDSVEDRRIAAECGADAYIRKDSFMEHVFALINSVKLGVAGPGVSPVRPPDTEKT